MTTIAAVPGTYPTCVPKCLEKDPSVSRRPRVSTTWARSQVVSSRTASCLCVMPGSCHQSDSDWGTSNAFTLRGASETQSPRCLHPMEWHQNFISSRSCCKVACLSRDCAIFRGGCPGQVGLCCGQSALGSSRSCDSFLMSEHAARSRLVTCALAVGHSARGSSLTCLYAVGHAARGRFLTCDCLECNQHGCTYMVMRLVHVTCRTCSCLSKLHNKTWSLGPAHILRAAHVLSGLHGTKDGSLGSASCSGEECASSPPWEVWVMLLV